MTDTHLFVVEFYVMGLQLVKFSKNRYKQDNKGIATTHDQICQTKSPLRR
jgi:hypothetical protein